MAKTNMMDRMRADCVKWITSFAWEFRDAVMSADRICEANDER